MAGKDDLTSVWYMWAMGAGAFAHHNYSLNLESFEKPQLRTLILHT